MKIKKKILVLCPYPFDVAPSQRLRFEQYYSKFENDYSITISAFVSDPFWEIIYLQGNLMKKIVYTISGYYRRIVDLFRISKFDIVYIHLWVSPFGPPFFEWLVKLLSNKIVYDIDDMIFLKENKSKANPIITNLKGKNKCIYLFKNANHVITSTSYIKDFAIKLNSNVSLIPVSINTEIYVPKETYNLKNKNIVIGWSGSLSTSPYLHLLDEVLINVNIRYPFKLLVMGDPNFFIPGLNIEALPWKKEYEIETLKRFDIGLYPLPNEEWVLGKGGGKALQYMSLGIPTVASDLGINSKIIKHGIDGLLVNANKEWEAAIEDLMLNTSLREKLGFNGIQKVINQFSINSNVDKYLNIFSKLTNN